MKKVLTLLVLLCMVCTGAWAVGYTTSVLQNGSLITIDSYHWGNHVWVDGTTFKSTSATVNGDNYKFVLIGNSTDGYKLRNLGTGLYVVAPKGTTSNAASATTYQILDTTPGGAPSSSSSYTQSGTSCVVFRNGTNNNQVIHQGTATADLVQHGYGSLTGSWGGSTWVITSVETPSSDNVQNLKTTISAIYGKREKVGYPSNMSAIEGYVSTLNVEDYYFAQKALNNVYADNTVNLPEDGKAYTITSVTRNGTTRMISYSNTTQQLAIGSSDDNVFICHKLDNGKYVFTNNSGKYMRLLADSYKGDGTKWNDAYDATWSSFSIAKMPTEGNHYDSNTTADKVFGLLTIQGPVNGRGNGTIYLMAAASQFNSGNDNDLYFTDSGNSCGFRFEEVPNPNTIKLTNPNKDADKKTLLDKRYVGTFSAPYAVQLPDKVEAYIATVSDDVVTFAKLGEGHIVPKNTGVMLYAPDAENDITESAIPATSTITIGNGTNVFVGSNAGTISMQTGYYVLGKKDAGVGFYPAKEGSTLARNKAYLNLSQHPQVSAFRFDFEEGGITTAISSALDLDQKNEGVAYDLAGRRCNIGAKGISIVGNKKVIR